MTSLKLRVQRALDYYDCRPYHLAKISGVSQAVVHRLAKGEQEGANSKTIDKLDPYLSLKMPKGCMDGMRRRAKKARGDSSKGMGISG